MKELAIDTRDLGFGYPGQRIFGNVTLSLTQKKKTALLAPNGAGKSTLIYLLSSMLKPDKGDIEVRCDQQQLDLYAFRQHCGVCVNQSYLLQDFSIAENLARFSSLQQNIDPQYLQDLVTMFDLTDMLGKTCKMLSQGQLKKVSLVRALMHKPDFLFLDEPTNGLDARARDLLAGFIKKLDSLVLIASHDRKWATEITQQVLTIENGDVHAL